MLAALNKGDMLFCNIRCQSVIRSDVRNWKKQMHILVKLVSQGNSCIHSFWTRNEYFPKQTHFIFTVNGLVRPLICKMRMYVCRSCDLNNILHLYIQLDNTSVLGITFYCMTKLINHLWTCLICICFQGCYDCSAVLCFIVNISLLSACSLKQEAYVWLMTNQGRYIK